MKNAKYLCLTFALLALQAYCDPKWVKESFSILPNLFITSEVLPVSPMAVVVDLAPGPINSTNLFSLGVRAGPNETNDISILNTTALSSIREFFDIGSLYPLDTVAIVSIPGSVFYTAVVRDRNRIKQIYGFPMPTGEYFPEEMAITESTDQTADFKVHQLIAHGPDPVVIYTEIKKDIKNLYIALSNLAEKKVDKRILVASGNITMIFCDTDRNVTNALCLYKIGDAMYRAFVTLLDENVTPVILKQATDSKDEVYLPQAVVANKGYFTCFYARAKENATDLLGLVFDGLDDAKKATDLSMVPPLKSFKERKDFFPLQRALAYGDGVAAFYRNMEAGGNQTWYYAIYDKDLTVKGSEVKLADVIGDDPFYAAKAGFAVAKEPGVGAVNMVGFTYTTWHGALVINVYYGQILSESPSQE